MPNEHLCRAAERVTAHREQLHVMARVLSLPLAETVTAGTQPAGPEEEVAAK